MSKVITAYNIDVQQYIEQPNKRIKSEIVSEIKELSLERGINFNRLFPQGSKRYKVLDEIVYLLSNGGICKISSSKLSERIGASVRTVYEAVKHIKQLDLFIVAGLADGKNKYVFLYKNHANFYDIIADVFYLDYEQFTELNAEQNAEQENAEDSDSKGIDRYNTNPISYNYFNKQEKDIIRESIERGIINNKDNEKEKAKEYLINPYQRFLYTALKYDNHLHEDIKANSLIIALRAGSNIDESTYNKALVAVRKIDKHLYFGGTCGSIPALFDKIYRDHVRYSDYFKSKVKPINNRDTSVYFNWLKGTED